MTASLSLHWDKSAGVCRFLHSHVSVSCTAMYPIRQLYWYLNSPKSQGTLVRLSEWFFWSCFSGWLVIGGTTATVPLSESLFTSQRELSLEVCSPALQITVLEYMTPILHLAYEASNKNKKTRIEHPALQFSERKQENRHREVRALFSCSWNHLFMD